MIYTLFANYLLQLVQLYHTSTSFNPLDVRPKLSTCQTSCQDFCTSDLHNGEYSHHYYLSDLHPVHIGDRLDGDRYKIVHKLGYGTPSTVWLARDRGLRKYVALKIKEAGISKFHNELDILNHISRFKSDHPGRIYSAASLLLRQFWIDGPNGLVFQVCGPSISRLYDCNIRLRTHLARSIALEVTQGLAYLHSEGICHGDLTAENVLFQLTNFDTWSEHKLYAQLGSPKRLCWTATIPSRLGIFFKR